MSGFGNLQLLGIRDQVKTLSMAPTDFRSVLQVVNYGRSASLHVKLSQPPIALRRVGTRGY